MTLPTLIAPSVLAADFARLEQELLSVEKAGADWHHLDVMDGHYVPNLSFGLPVIERIKEFASLPLDVHIMVSNPDETALKYVKAGANVLSFHPEVSKHPHYLASALRDAGCVPGIAINPGTPVEIIWPLLHVVGQITMMSVNPGFGGQKYIEQVTKKIGQVAQRLKQEGLQNSVRIEVDGGINQQTAAEVNAHGANVLVAGTYVYGSLDRAQRITELRRAVALA